MIPHGYVYLIQVINSNMYKIGHTSEVKARFDQIQSCCPLELLLIHTIESRNCCALEQAIHKKYNLKHIRGEWFELCFEDVADIKQTGDIVWVLPPDRRSMQIMIQKVNLVTDSRIAKNLLATGVRVRRIIVRQMELTNKGETEETSSELNAINSCLSRLKAIAEKES